MNIGAIQPHVWFSIFVVIAAGGIAVLATLLKSRNDRLRDILVELRARHEEDQRRLMAAARAPAPRAAVPEVVAVSPAAVPAAAVPPAAAPEAAAPMETPAPRNSEVRDRNIAIRQAEERAFEFASRQGRRRHPSPPPESVPKLDEMNPREALSEWLNKRAAARAPQKKAPAPEPAAEPDREPEKAVSQSTVFIDESLWESILGQPAVRFEVIQGAATGLPAGLHDRAVLNRLLESNKPFHGLAVALGVSLNDGRAVSRDVMLHVEQLVRSLLRDGDFACQTGDDEFLLLCPGKHGAEAQRRLNDISERLWDFQLRGVGNFSILFSTGQARVEGEPLREAVATASARFEQSRRARRIVSLASRRAASAGA